MKYVDSPIFGVVPKPSSFEELLRIIQKPPQPQRSNVRMWRGHGDISWPIHSTAYRRLALDRPPSENDMIYYEENLLMRATHRGFRHIGGRRLSDFELLARLQHHGAATRLVDATRSALVGLYFSVISHPRKVGAIIGFHTDFLGGYEGIPIDKDYKTEIGSLKNIRHPQTWEPPDVSSRIAAQHAQFLYSSVSDDHRGSLCIDKDPDALLVIAISTKMKQKCCNILSNTFDIRHSTLFPDMDGFGFSENVYIIEGDSYRW